MIVNKLFGLEGKVALVTGAAQGLGQGYAVNLARAGCKCVCADLGLERLQETLDLIAKEGGETHALAMNVTDMESIRKGFADIYKKLRRIDIVVNNAGTEIAEPFLDVTPEHYDAIMAVNHKGTYFVMQEAAKYMKEQESGKIINIGSLGSFIGLADSSVYCSSKGAVVQLTKTASIELAKYNIQVNAIAPGYFLTAMTKPFFEDKTHREWIENRIPLGKVGTTDDLAGTLIFLASPASNYITGQVIVVDGGWLAS
jgi:NAD(P)-dependent dehydrogenase (short-subunit alcohol dehydrogenase family)